MRTTAKITVLAVVVIGISLYFFPIKTDRGFICRDTLSKNRYTEWPGGFRTAARYTKSPLEEYLENKNPSRVTHDWVSYNGTGRNIFGSATIFAHGSPGAILQFDERTFGYIAALPDKKKDELIATLKSRDDAAITASVNSLWEEVFKKWPAPPSR